MLLKLLVVSVEVSKLVWQDVSVRYEVEACFAKLLLHPHHVVAQSILSCDFITLREMVDLLVLIQTFVDIGFA